MLGPGGIFTFFPFSVNLTQYCNSLRYRTTKNTHFDLLNNQSEKSFYKCQKIQIFHFIWLQNIQKY